VEGTGPRAAPGIARPRSTDARLRGDQLIEGDGELDALAVALARLEDRVGGLSPSAARLGSGRRLFSGTRSPARQRLATVFAAPLPAPNSGTSPTA
jgi:hypothetical protein